VSVVINYLACNEVISSIENGCSSTADIRRANLLQAPVVIIFRALAIAGSVSAENEFGRCSDIVVINHGVFGTVALVIVLSG